MAEELGGQVVVLSSESMFGFLESEGLAGKLLV